MKIFRRLCERSEAIQRPYEIQCKDAGLLRLRLAKTGLTLCFTFLMLISSALFAKPIEIVMWHAMAGSVGSELTQLIHTFNASQTSYVIKPVYKGSYAETLTAYAAAYRVHAAPAMLQVFDAGGTMMMSSKGVIKPVGKLLQEQRVTVDLATFWPTVARSYMQANQLVAFPLNVSFPLMYYDADKLKKLGYTSANFPRTWDQFEILLNKLKASGAVCPYTTAYPTWIHIESFLALHHLQQQLLTVAYYHPALRHHLERLVRWRRQQLFEYAGRVDEATILFTSRHCAMFSQSSGAYQNLTEVVSFPVGIASIPYDDKFVAHRGANLVGGGALWVTSGQTPAVEEGIAQFFKFMLQPSVQAAWYKKTGYLPLLKQAAQEKGVLSLVQTEWGEDTQDPLILIQSQQRIRAMNDELMESLLAGLQTVDQILKKISQFSEFAQSRFEKNHGVG